MVRQVYIHEDIYQGTPFRINVPFYPIHGRLDKYQGGECFFLDYPDLLPRPCDSDAIVGLSHIPSGDKVAVEAYLVADASRVGKSPDQLIAVLDILHMLKIPSTRLTG